MTGARELAFTINALLSGASDEAWMKGCYEQNQRARIGQHIRFADFWYSANGQFSDLKEFTREIASDAGLTLDANEAFQWLGTGGFTTDVTKLPAIADISIAGIKLLTQRFTSTNSEWALNGVSVVKLNLRGAKETFHANYREGRVERIRVFERDGKLLPCIGLYGIVLEALQTETILERIVRKIAERTKGARDPLPFVFQLLEVWINDGWIVGSSDSRYPAYKREQTEESGVIHGNRDIAPAKSAR
jgi:hypothetical protein